MTEKGELDCIPQYVSPVLSIELIIPRFIKQVNESVKQKCSMGLKCKIALNLFIFCSKYVQSNLNQPSRIIFQREEGQ